MKLFDLLRKKIGAYDDATNFTCDICGREVFDGARVCAPCRAALPWNDSLICPFCGRRVKAEGTCIECKSRPLGVAYARSSFLHEKEASRLVVRYKRGEKYLFRTLSELALPLVEREFMAADTVVPIPMSEKGLKKRGYNQSELLAERLALLTGKKLVCAVVKRKETAAQKFLSRAERERNLEDSFHVALRKEVKGKKILIVDDTLTTGATVSSVANLLRRAGAAEVYAYTFTSVELKRFKPTDPE